jgi:hypothetical protein
MPDYTPPNVDRDAFHCPHCAVYAKHYWKDLRWDTSGAGYRHILNGRKSKCSHCEEYTIWVENTMVYPKASVAPQPAEDMPENVKSDFEEARMVVEDSPRAAAALLRLAMEKLARDLTGDEKQTLHNLIGDLVKEGRIDQRIQQALDSVRVTGNEFVHPGEMDQRDNQEIALRLFHIVNAIVELTITRENLIEEEYNNIPEDQRKGIENRDS